MTESPLDRILDKYKEVVSTDRCQAPKTYPFESDNDLNVYALSSLCAATGKTAIALDLAYTMSRKENILVVDTSPQCTLTRLMFNKRQAPDTIRKSFWPYLTGEEIDETREYSYWPAETFDEPWGALRCHVVPGDEEMTFLAPLLYRQISSVLKEKAGTSAARDAERLLFSMRSFVETQAELRNCYSALIDTSPSPAGGTELAWIAADRLIIPIRADEFSLTTLDLLLGALSSEDSEFGRLKKLADVKKGPTVAAIVVTMIRPSSSNPELPESEARPYIERAVAIAQNYRDLFPYDDVSDAIVLIDDFRGAGRISSGLGIPLARLKAGEFRRVAGLRVQVNEGIERCQKQLRYLASML